MWQCTPLPPVPCSSLCQPFLPLHVAASVDAAIVIIVLVMRLVRIVIAMPRQGDPTAAGRGAAGDCTVDCGHGRIQLNWTGAVAGAAAVGRRRAQSAGDAVERNFNFMLSAKYSF